MGAVGVDLEQFVRDPYATGIQRVLQQLALHWPSEIAADFVVPHDDGTFSLLNTAQAADLLSLPFSTHGAADVGDDANRRLREQVNARVQELRDDRSIPRVRLGQLVSLYDGWLLPEVSYLPSVLERFDVFARCMPVAMIGYDALPMTDPGNYRFTPGAGSDVSEYFRRLATADAVVCISDYARTVILDRLRRDRTLSTLVAHPGGDHVPMRASTRGDSTRDSGPVTFVRLGTMEARKQPLEILEGFLQAVDAGADARLVFIGNPSSSSEIINARVSDAARTTDRVTWIQGASDEDVLAHVANADAFLSIGTEGYGIPVLEAIRLGTPVLFDGIQPAAELMQGRGARRIDAGSPAALASELRDQATSGLAALQHELDPRAVPTWRDFAATVAASAVPQ